MEKIKKYKNKFSSVFFLFYPLFHVVLGGSEGAVKSVNNLIDKLYTPIQCAGFLITIYGVGMLILAFRSENHDAVTKHIMQICIGVTLYGLKSFLGS